ncbi:unnamed protein product [Sphagnum jensenii]|uniref:Core-2/I-branching beta-1,6-N-acetylglucosaminyltransferase family protein n=1 Tax=Sphagnum jensenii TaxID=128206 RepID=A0ABP0X507_9BRYO
MLLDHRDITMIIFTLLATALVFGVVRSNLHMTLFGVVRNPQEVLATLNASHDEVSSSAAAAAPAGRSSSSSSVFDNNVTEPRSSRTDSQAFNISGCPREPVVAPLKNNSSEGLDHHHHVFQYMSATYNNMTDDELLWMATRISMRSRGAPPKQHTPGRIAFMFLIRGPLPFARLWERYFFGHERLYSVYVHAHPSYVPDDVPLSSPFYGRFIRREEVRWARISMYNAERRLLGNALLDYSNEWFVLLSEACIPLDNFRNTYEYITSSRLNFVQSNLEQDDSSAAALVVKEGSSGRRGGGGGGGSRLSREQEQEMGPEITRQNFRKGSQWFQINRELAMLLAADTKLYDKFALSFCNPSPRACYMDEHYLPTVAALWLPEKLAYRTLTYFHFRGHAPHPDHWDKTRVNKNLIQRLRRGGDGRNYTTSIDINGLQPSQNKSSSVCYFFARKFDADALELLLDIATEVMGIQALD